MNGNRFEQDKYLINQKVLSLGSKYYVYDQDQRPLFYIDRAILKIRAPIEVFADETKQQKLLSLQPASFWEILNLNFALTDGAGETLGYFRRQGWLSLLRRTWFIFDAHNQPLAIAQEDSWWKAIARRVLDLAFLRTNFDILSPTGQKLGEFVRRWTVADKYVLDLTPDPDRRLDRRVAVGLAILLDNAESR